MTGERFVRTQAIKTAVRGRETAVLDKLGIKWGGGRQHVRCPYPDHDDRNPSWRWDQDRGQAICTCISKADSIFDVTMKVRGLDFEEAKLLVAELIGRNDLIEERGGSFTPDKLLNPPPEQREHDLARQYLAYRLNVETAHVPKPGTPVVGWSALDYYDPPANDQGKPVLVGQWPCVVFGTLRSDGQRHAQRIYVEPGGQGKAQLGRRSDGVGRNPKKSATGTNNAGCAVLWGDPENTPRIILCEGIETGAALAIALANEVATGTVTVAAGIAASGVEGFRLWPNTKRVTVAADCDEAKSTSNDGYKRGERAARKFAEKQSNVDIDLALPGKPGEAVDWLDILLRDGPEAVVEGIENAERIEPPVDDEAVNDGAVADGDGMATNIIDLAERARSDKGAPFEPEALEALSIMRASDPAAFQRLRDDLKRAGIPMRDLGREIQKYSFRVIQGGAQGGDGATERAGPYKIVNGAICHERDTKEGPITVPLANFDVRIVGEEIRDDGAERITVFAVGGALQGGKPLPRAEVLADRYSSMNWVTASWGTAAVVYAGQGTKDHLRVAVQMLSGEVPRRTVFGHLGWREIGGEWFYLHHGGAIGPNGPNPEIQVQTGDLRITCYALPEPPVGDELKTAVRASLSTLQLGPPMLAYSLLGMVYSAPLGEVADLDLSGFIVGPTGAQKSELTAIAQAHYGVEFNRKRLPGNWATTANSLEKQAFLVKDALFTIDDFAPAGTVADVARQHKDADRVFRGQGNRAGRGRMRPDGSRRPEYFPRGIILSSGEDVPRGESLRSRGLFLEVSRKQVDLVRLTEAQDAAAAGLFAQAMAAYVQWLAPQIDTLKERIPVRHRELRTEARKQPVSHDRTPDIVASLATGWEMFLRFALEAEAITDNEWTAYWQQAWAMLSEAAEAQAGFQQSEEPARRFIALLAAAIASGQAHVVDAATNEEPADAGNWGWQRRTHTSGTVEHEEWQPKGMCVGWIDIGDLYLNPESSFAAVQRLAQAQGASLPITAQTLWKRLFEKGILASRDEARQRNIIRKVIGGNRRNAIHILADTLLSHKSGPTGPLGPRPRESAAPGAEKLGRFSGGEEKAAHENGPQPKENSGPGPNGPNGPEIEHKGPSSGETFADPEEWSA